MALFPFFYGLFGLIVGSFLNVCIYRIPRRESIVFPGSHCPHCGNAIRPYDNIPVLSYFWLMGKCRFCRAGISLRYPFVELLTGIAFYFCAFKWQATGATFVNSAFLAIMIVLIFIDYEHQILPNVITLTGTLLGIVLAGYQDRSLYSDTLTFQIASVFSPDKADRLIPWVGSIFGAVASAGALFLVAFIYKATRKRQGLGMGDVKMLALVGAFLGWRLALLTVFAGSLLGSVLGILLISFKGKSLQTKLPFGTFLGAAAGLVLFFGLPFFNWYTSAR